MGRLPFPPTIRSSSNVRPQTYENATKLGGDQKRVFMLGSSCGGTLSLATAHKLIELGREGQLKGVINMAGGTVHEANVPKHLQHLMKSMEENATDVPIIDGQTAKMINGTLRDALRLRSSY